MRLLAIACLAACTYTSGAHTDAGSDVDAFIDAPIDAPVAGPSVIDRCSRDPVTSLDLGTVQVGQFASADLVEDQSAIVVEFEAASVGDFHATLIVGASEPPFAMTEIPVTVHVVAAQPGLFAGIPSLHLVGPSSFVISNTTTTTAIDLDSATVTSSDAPPSLFLDTVNARRRSNPAIAAW